MSRIEVQAFCQCGWTGPRRPLDGAALAGERADLDAHVAVSGHRRFVEGCPPPAGYHSACAHFHDLNDDCPAPPDSPRGRLGRIAGRSPLRRPDVAFDRLAAIAELRGWLDGQEAEAVIGARLNRCTWRQMGAAAGLDETAARARWQRLTGCYEALGILPADPADCPASGELSLPA